MDRYEIYTVTMGGVPKIPKFVGISFRMTRGVIRRFRVMLAFALLRVPSRVYICSDNNQR